jgi:Trk K+ transport system NAD-binding subunit
VSPAAGFELRPGDRLLAVGEADAIERLERLLAARET